MNRKYSLFVSIAVVAMSLVSCDSVMDDKKDIDAGHVVSFSSSIEVASTASTFNSITIDLNVNNPADALEIGALVSTKDDFSGASYKLATKTENGYDVVVGKLQENTTYYVKPYVLSKNNDIVFGNAVSVKTPVAPKLSIKSLDNQTYTCTVVAATEKSRTFNVTLNVDAEDSTKVKVLNLDAYFSEYGYVAPDANVFDGVIDWQKETITIANGQKMGYKDVIIVGYDGPSYEDDNDGADIVLEIRKYGDALYVPNAFGCAAEDGLWEAYSGGFTLEKK